MRKYRLMLKTSGKGYASYTLAVPVPLAERLLQRNRRQFTVELTEEGILYRPTSPEVPAPLPHWLRS